MRKPRMGSTLRYVPFGAWIEAPLMRRYHNKLLDERYTTLNKLREVLTLQHAVRQQREVYNLAHLAVLATYLFEACITLLAQLDNALRELLAHGALLVGELRILLILDNLLEA